MVKTKTCEIRAYHTTEKENALNIRLKKWMEENNGGLPHASDLGLIAIAYSMGKLGEEGMLYLDLNEKEFYGMPNRSNWIYIK